MDTLARNDIRVFAISPDTQKTLAKFAQKHGITYPLLSDAESRVIREFGILNTHIPPDHEWFGIAYPGMYMVGRDGRVFDKSFFAEHQIRESMNDILQESFGARGLEKGETQVLSTAHLTAGAYFASPTIRRQQLVVLTVELLLGQGTHVLGRPLPEGHTPLDLSLDGSDLLHLDEVHYPEAKEVYLKVLGKSVPAYTGRLAIKARCRGGNIRGDQEIPVTARLRYQACDDQACYMPRTVTFLMTLHGLPHDWQKID